MRNTTTQTTLLTWVCVLLAALMWYSHTDIFQRLEAYNGKELTFGVQALNTFLALGFSILTAICIRKIENYKYVALFGLFDGFAIFLHFQSNIEPHTFNWVGSVFLGSLMFFLVSMIWKLADSERNKETEYDRIVKERDEIQRQLKALETEKATQQSQPEHSEPSLPQIQEPEPVSEEHTMTVTKLVISKKTEKQYTTLQSLNGAINRGSQDIEYYFNRATPEVQAEYLANNPEVRLAE